MYRVIKVLILFCFIGLLAILGLVIGFFIANDAPILHGDIEYNLHYKPGQHIDLYLPTTEKYSQRPVLLYFHGGAWIVGRKESINNARFNTAINRLRSQGYAIVSPSYTLAEEESSPFPACIEDAYAASDWIIENADVYNFDLSNVGVMGESAGGHLAMMTGFNSNQHDVSFDYIVDVYGPTDLYRLYKDMIPFMDTIKQRIPFLGDMDIPKMLFGFDPESDTLKAKALAKAYSPVEYINEDSPPLLIIHGEEDRVVPVSQSHELVDSMLKFNLNTQTHYIEGMDHAFRGATDVQKEKTQKWIEEFILDQYGDR